MSETPSTDWASHPQTVTTGRALRPTAQFMRRHPARWIALGLGSGLSPWAPGTVGTLWGWVSFLVIQHALARSMSGPLLDVAWALILAFGWLIGCWSCTRTAQAMRVADRGYLIVHGEIAVEGSAEALYGSDLVKKYYMGL